MAGPAEFANPSMMDQVLLGGSGLAVSELCLGTNMFGDELDRSAAAEIVGRFRERGGTFFDTAPNYSEGRSEALLGQLLAHERDQVVIATKVYGPTGRGPNDRSTSRRHIIASVDGSLRRLKSNYIDLYQLHRWDPTTPLNETLSTLNDLVRQGKVLHAGMSNFVGWQIERSLAMQSRFGHDRFIAVQSQYSLIERGIELEVLPVARTHGLTTLAWSPLAEGFLAKHISRDGTSSYPARLSRRTAESGEFSETDFSVAEMLRTLSIEWGLPQAALAIAWLLAQERVIPVLGARTVQQLDEVVQASDIDREPLREALAQLDQLSAPAKPYPYSGFPEVEGRPLRGRLRDCVAE